MTRYTSKCVHVEDGDTFKTAGDKWIRLSDVDTPEINQPGYSAAKELLESLILDKDITYEPVGESYGRIVAHVWVNDDSVNEIIRLR